MNLLVEAREFYDVDGSQFVRKANDSPAPAVRRPSAIRHGQKKQAIVADDENVIHKMGRNISLKATAAPPPCFFSNLPLDVISYIFQYLSFAMLSLVPWVSRQWKIAYELDCTWETMYHLYSRQLLQADEEGSNNLRVIVEGQEEGADRRQLEEGPHHRRIRPPHGGTKWNAQQKIQQCRQNLDAVARSLKQQVQSTTLRVRQQAITVQSQRSIIAGGTPQLPSVLASSAEMKQLRQTMVAKLSEVQCYQLPLQREMTTQLQEQLRSQLESLQVMERKLKKMNSWLDSVGKRTVKCCNTVISAISLQQKWEVFEERLVDALLSADAAACPVLLRHRATTLGELELLMLGLSPSSALKENWENIESKVHQLHRAVLLEGTPHQIEEWCTIPVAHLIPRLTMMSML